MIKKIFYLILLLVLVSCSNQKETSIVMTVKGSISSNDMGQTLSHEHVLVDFIGADSTGYHRWDKDEVTAKVLPYLQQIKELGIQTLVECTPQYLGRDPLLCKMLSEKSGIHILTNTGLYGAMKDQFIPQYAFTETADQLAERWIAEWKNGIEDTGIKPGFIKIAVARDSVLSELHAKLARAAAKTHLATGLTINSHTGPGSPAFHQLEILEEEGVAPEAFIWTHANRGTDDERIRFAKQGGWISIDKMRDDPKQIESIVKMLSIMKASNVLNHVLLSHDAGWYHVGEQDGGDFRDYASLSLKLIPALKNSGFTDLEINQLLVENPKHAYTIRVRKI